jgi:hypothetical protein
VTETAGCSSTVVVWEGEAPEEPRARNRHSVRLALPKTPPFLSRTRMSASTNLQIDTLWGISIVGDQVRAVAEESRVPRAVCRLPSLRLINCTTREKNRLLQVKEC